MNHEHERRLCHEIDRRETFRRIEWKLRHDSRIDREAARAREQRVTVRRRPGYPAIADDARVR